jgi:hypothetical protein
MIPDISLNINPVLTGESEIIRNVMELYIAIGISQTCCTGFIPYVAQCAA